MANNIFQGPGTAWDTPANWSLGAVPTANDGNIAIFNASSPTCSLGASNNVCNAIDFTGYVNTLQFGVRTLTVSGNVVLANTMTWTGTGVFAINATGSITSNGFQSPSTLTFGFQGTSQTYTLQDDLTVLGPLSLNGTTALTINNNGSAKILYASGNVSTSAGGCQGTAKIVMNGTGQWSSTALIQNDFEINTAGTITFGTNVRFGVGTFTYTAGTVVTTSSTATLGLTGNTTTQLDVDGIVFNNIVFLGGSSAVITLLSDIKATGQVSAVSNNTINGFNINIDGSGSYTVGGGASGVIQGSAVLNFIGASCVWATGTGTNRLAVNINTSGTLTCTGTTIHGTGTLTYISGTVVTTSHTLSITTSCTLDTDPISWFNVTFPASITVTYSSDLTVTGTFNSGGGTVMNAQNINLSGILILGGSQNLSGTTVMNFLSGSSWTGGSGQLRLNAVINASAGSFTMTGAINYNTGTFTYTSGTVVTTGSFVTFGNTTTLNLAGVVFNDVLFNQGTFTLNSTFTATGTCTFATGSNVFFIGTHGFALSSMICETANRSITLKAGITYTISSLMKLKGTQASRVSVLSGTVLTDTFLLLDNAAQTHNFWCNATDVNSGNPATNRQVHTAHGTLLRTTNWFAANPDYFSFF